MQEKREECTLSAHSSSVHSVTIAPNSKYILSGSRDKSIIIWNLEDRREECIFSSHLKSINSINISWDMKYMVSASDDKSIKIWNLKERKEEYTITTHSDSVKSVIISKSGNYIVSGSEDNSIKIWNLTERREEWAFVGHTDWVTSVAISQDDKYIVSGSLDNSIKIWNLSEKKEEFTLLGHTNWVNSVAISHNDKYIVSGSRDKSIAVWNLPERRKEYTFAAGHTDSIKSIVISQDDKYIVSGSRDCSIKVWNLQETREECTLFGHSGWISSVAISYDSKYIVSGSLDKTIKIWNLQQKREEFTLSGHANSVKSVAISQDGNYIASGGDDKLIKIWNMQEKTGEYAFYSARHSDSISLSEITENENHTIESIPRVGFLTAQEQIEKLSLYKSPEWLSLLQQHATDNKDFIDFFKYMQNGINLGPQSYSDPYFYDKIAWCNAIDAIKKDSYSNISEKACNLHISEFMYTIIHICSNAGKVDDLQNFFEMSYKNNNSISLRSDIFRRSPIYYSIIKNHQSCTDLLLDFLVAIKEISSIQFQTSFTAIQYDLNAIITNSSRVLPKLLQRLLVSSSAYITIPELDIPLYHFYHSPIPLLSDFIPINDISNNKIPAKFKRTVLVIPSLVSSKDTLEFMESIVNCKNDEIFRTSLIQIFINIQWQYVKRWALFYTFLTICNIVLFLLLLEFGVDNWLYLIAFLIVNIMLATWEIIQIIMSYNDYCKDAWNLADVIRICTTVLWIVLELFDASCIYVTSIAATLSLIRGLTGFKIFDGTRYYVRLILNSLSDIRYFIVVLSYSTFSFSVLFMISRNESLSFESLWKFSWGLNFGIFDDSRNSKTNHFLDYIAYFGSTVINVVLMLNLLISILGDSYEKFQLEKSIIDYKEKLKYTIELQQMMFWSDLTFSLNYLHGLVSPLEEEESEDWNGRIIYMENNLKKELNIMGSRLEKSISSIDPVLSLMQQTTNNKVSLVETAQKEIEMKCISMDAKISSIEITQKEIDIKISSVEEKLQKILEVVSSR